jgi:hypothetical protein
MKQYRNHDDDFEIVHGKKILRDGRVYHAGSVALMDAVQRGVAKHPARLTDAQGNSGLTTLSRPGFRCLLDDDAGAAAKERGYRDYEKTLCDAWRGKDEEEPGEDDDRRVTDRMQDHQARMRELYSQADAETASAWRGGGR